MSTEKRVRLYCSPCVRLIIQLKAGGTPQGKGAIHDVEIIDFSDHNPKYHKFRHLTHARYYVYPVILPDRSILILGGKSGKKGHLHNPTTQEHHHHGGGLPHQNFQGLHPYRALTH